MNPIVARLLFLTALLVCATARADSYTFVDWNLQGVNSYKYLAQGQQYSGKWNISDDPNWSSSLNILSIETDFWFADDGNDPDSSTTWVKTGYWKDQWEKKWTRHGGWTWVKKSVWVSTGGYYDTVENPNNYEEVDIKVGDHLAGDNVEVDGVISYTGNLLSYDLVSFDLSTILSITADIGADGMLEYYVKAVKGDTYLKETRVTVTAETPPPPSVPDSGSTAVLLVGGLVGLAVGLRRRQ
jgi:hypothetical protein